MNFRLFCEYCQLSRDEGRNDGLNGWNHVRSLDAFCTVICLMVILSRFKKEHRS